MEDSENPSADRPASSRSSQACQRCRSLKTRCLPSPQPGMCQRYFIGAWIFECYANMSSDALPQRRNAFGQIYPAETRGYAVLRKTPARSSLITLLMYTLVV